MQWQILWDEAAEAWKNSLLSENGFIVQFSFGYKEYSMLLCSNIDQLVGI